MLQSHTKGPSFAVKPSHETRPRSLALKPGLAAKPGLVAKPDREARPQSLTAKPGQEDKGIFHHLWCINRGANRTFLSCMLLII